VRSKLFVPASRPELFAKAVAGDADALSFDLEDAVDEAAKPAARIELQRFFGAPPDNLREKLVIVRVNGVDSPHFERDIEAVVCDSLNVINLPKVESAEMVRAAAEQLQRIERVRGLASSVRILANIESARGLRLAHDIAASHSRVMGLQVGLGDLFSPLGIVGSEPAATQAVRIAVRLAAGEAGIAAFDGAFVNIADPDGYRADAQAAQRLGFSGKSCIHPSQVPVANEVFRPDQSDIDHAIRVVAAAARAKQEGVGAFVVDGRLVDGPFITRAIRLVSRYAPHALAPMQQAQDSSTVVP
jgi:citrate lyase subunit beta/citryl-CoA lyase